MTESSLKKLARPYVDHGRKLHRQGKFDVAIRECKIALQLDPESSEAHLELGMSRYLAGDSVKAVRSLKKAEELADEDSPLARSARQLIDYIRRGK